MGKRRNEEDWVQVDFWGGSKDGESGLFLDYELSTNDPIILEQKRDGRIIGEEVYIAGPETDFLEGRRPFRVARYSSFRRLD